jgi:hypothetical protein
MVKIVEFFKQDYDEGLPFNVVEDLIIFMRNNPNFYRKLFYPTILSFKNLVDRKQKVNPRKLFTPMIKHAIVSYCKEYDVGKRPEQLIDDTELRELIRTLYEEELENIRNGEYK